MTRVVLLVTLAVLAAGCSWSNGRGVPAAERSATLELRQVQTAFGYPEGSIGVLRVRDTDGRPVGPVLLASREARQLGPGTFESDFPPLDLPPGDYVVELWQHPCSGVCASDEEIVEANDPPGDQLDRCTARVTLAAGETRRITATWAPGKGCAAFE
ncbi:MAG: hypothetical protein R3C15_18030 [Thermoleophilia bacterium]